MNDVVVLIDVWQSECDGMPFQLGDDVNWTARKSGDTEFYDKFSANPSDYHYVHSENLQRPRTDIKILLLQGNVKKISANYLTFDYLTNKVVNSAGVKTLSIDKANSNEQERIQDWRFCFYVVHLDNVKIDHE